MSDICNQISHMMHQCSYKFKTVSITHLADVQDAVGILVRQELVSPLLYEKWHFYLDTNKDLPEAKTIIVIAMPQPITRLRFNWQGSTYLAEVAPSYINEIDESRAAKILNSVLASEGYRIAKAHLALKTLAVRSGLAKYGRNNISYVPGMGSFLILIAFYTDYNFEEDNWREPEVMKACENCLLCRENCPTGSIPTDRFLIHAETCLGSLNEREPKVPYWVQLQPDWQNAFIGCMRCQFICPVDEPYLHRIVDGSSFSEEETSLVLNNSPLKNLSSETRQKLGNPHPNLYKLLAPHLSALIEKHKKVIK